MTIERAAKAICEVEDNDPMCSPMNWTDWIDAARVSLEAIAEPTPEMIDAVQSRYYGPELNRSFIEEVWRVMLAAMMKEFPTEGMPPQHHGKW